MMAVDEFDIDGDPAFCDLDIFSIDICLKSVQNNEESTGLEGIDLTSLVESSTLSSGMEEIPMDLESNPGKSY